MHSSGNLQQLVRIVELSAETDLWAPVRIEEQGTVACLQTDVASGYSGVPWDPRLERLMSASGK